MYSRNLAKNPVRASPTSASALYNGTFQSGPQDENRYRFNLPPKYDGNRFSPSSPSVEPEPKHHTAPPLSQMPKEGEKIVCTESSHEEAKHQVLPNHPCPIPGESNSLGNLISALKEHVSGDDLLLIVIILMLAAEGENSELTILLLALLLLVK